MYKIILQDKKTSEKVEFYCNYVTSFRGYFELDHVYFCDQLLDTIRLWVQKYTKIYHKSGPMTNDIVVVVGDRELYLEFYDQNLQSSGRSINKGQNGGNYLPDKWNI